MIRLRIVVLRSFEMFLSKGIVCYLTLGIQGTRESKITKKTKGKRMPSAHSKTER